MAKHVPWMILLAGLAATLALGGPTPAEVAANRDPFWPVNYTPAAGGGSGNLSSGDLLQIANLSPEEQALIKSRLRVGGILQQKGSRIAIINKQVVRRGDELTVELSGRTYRFLIRSLEEKNIVLEPAESEEKEQPQSEGATP